MVVEHAMIGFRTSISLSDRDGGMVSGKGMDALQREEEDVCLFVNRESQTSDFRSKLNLNWLRGKLVLEKMDLLQDTHLHSLPSDS